MANNSYFHRTSTSSYLYSTLTESFDQQSEREPKKEAFILYDEKFIRTSVTFWEAQNDSILLAAGLLKTYPGLRPECRICIYTENNWEYLLSVLAVCRLGAIAALANTAQHNEEKILQVIEQLNCCGLIAESARIAHGRLHEILSTRNDWIFAVSDDNSEKLPHEVISIPDLIEIGRHCNEARKQILKRQKEVSPDSGAVVFLSSGSTGDPKAVLYSHFRLLNMLKHFFSEIGYTHCDKHVHDRPFSHMSGFLGGMCVPVCFGGTSISVSKRLAETSRESYTFLRVIEREKATGALLFGFVIYDMVHGCSAARDLNLSKLRIVMTGGQILSNDNVEKLLKLFPKLKLVHGYGLTEQALAAINVKGRDLLWMETFPGVEVKVVDANNQLVPINCPGEIWVRSSFIMIGYVADGKLNTARDEHGWLHTDDNGIMNESGELFIIGRMSDIIIRGPANVPVMPLEELLDGHPKVKKSAIVPVPDPRLGYDLCACVIPAEASLSDIELLDWCSSKFGNDRNGVNLRPKSCIFMDEFPLTISGKISKAKLKEIVKEKHGM